MVGVPQLTGRQKLLTALLILGCEPGRIEKRLKAAYQMVIAFIDPQLHIPPEFSNEFAALRAELHAEFLNRQEEVNAAWACEMAARIVAFYDKLGRAGRGNFG